MVDERLRVAIVFPADAKRQLHVEESRFADVAEALCAAGMEVVGAPMPMSL